MKYSSAFSYFLQNLEASVLS